MTVAHKLGHCMGLIAVMLECAAVMPVYRAGLDIVLLTYVPVMLEKPLPTNR